MIADALHAEMHVQVARLRKENPLLRKAADGTLTAKEVTQYLFNIHHLLQHTPVFLEHARRRALEAGEAQLAAHYEHKMNEEEGHDQWAVNDIAQLSPRAPDANAQTLSAMQAIKKLT